MFFCSVDFLKVQACVCVCLFFPVLSCSKIVHMLSWFLLSLSLSTIHFCFPFFSRKCHRHCAFRRFEEPSRFWGQFAWSFLGSQGIHNPLKSRGCFQRQAFLFKKWLLLAPINFAQKTLCFSVLRIYALCLSAGYPWRRNLAFFHFILCFLWCASGAHYWSVERYTNYNNRCSCIQLHLLV